MATPTGSWTTSPSAPSSIINGGNQLIIDELRVGNTWADVTPFAVVPEPSAALLLSLGSLLAFRRKR